MTVFYVDVSHHDWTRRGGNLDWARIRQATSPVMCARATYGDPGGLNYATRHFGDFQNAAKAAGFTTRGGFHNLVSGDQASINRQVDWFRSELDRYGCHWAMLDVERYPELVNNNRWPRWDDVRQFDDRWAAVESRVLAIYLPKWIWSGHLGSPDLRVLRGPLVASDYGTNANGSPTTVYASRGGDGGRGWTSYGGVTPAIWQFGSKLDVPGGSSDTCVDAYRGSLDQLRTRLTGISLPTDPTGGDMANPDWTQRDAYNANSYGYATSQMIDQFSIVAGEDPTVPGPGGKSTATNHLARFLRALDKKVDAIAAKVDIDPAELAAIEAAAKRGAEAGVAAQRDALVAVVLAALPDAALTRADVETALRSVLRSVPEA